MGYPNLTSYESIYTGGYSSLNSDYGNFIGYRMGADNLGFPGSAQTANQLTEAINAVKQGVKAFEVTMVSPETAEQIPKQHFKEMAALMKLTGVKPSVHAPIIDPAGFGERGYGGEFAREDAERRLIDVIKKSHDLDPNGNLPIVFHSSGGVPGTEWRPRKDTEPGDEDRFRPQKITVIDRDTGQIATQLEEERKYYLRTGIKDESEWEKGGTLRKPMDEIKTLNNSDWDNKLTNLIFYKKGADEVLRDMAPELMSQAFEAAQKRLTEKEINKQYPNLLPELNKAEVFLENTEQNLNTLFHRAYKYGTDEQRGKLKDLAEEMRKRKFVREEGEKPKTPLEMMSSNLNKYLLEFKNITDPGKGLAPKIYQPTEEFAMEKAAQTFGNVAFKSYEKFKDSTPIIAIENMYQGMAFSRAEDMKKLIDESRKQFVKKAVKEGISESEAGRQAKKIIGATWDVGHLNIMRKAGFKEEDVVKETEKIAKYVKHIHLTDNFGYSDSHLPPGMGNVPFKKILEKLEKAGVLDKARKIVEAPAFVQHFKKSPHPWTLGAFGSGIYGAKMGPYWNQVADVQGSYFGFPLAYMPEKHFSTYGAGFSSLPEELGGQIPGTQSRFSGTSNA